MITNFEEITKPITSVEEKYIPVLLTLFQTATKDNPITQKTISERTGLNGARVRTLVHAIRTRGLCPVIGTKSGYYMSTDHDELIKQYKSLIQRADSIAHAAKGIRQYLETKQGNLFT